MWRSLRNVDKHRSLQKRIIRLHLSISGFDTVYVHCTSYLVYGHTLHWTLWLPAGVQLVEFCRLQSREGQKVACGKCNRSFLSPSLFFWRISEEPEWSKGTPYLLTYAWWGRAKQSARILTSVVVNWSRRKSRSFSSVSRFRVAVERFFSRSAWASSMSYSNITLAFGGTIAKQYQWQQWR